MGYRISHSNGERDDPADTMEDARAILEARYGPDVVIHDEWEAAGWRQERRLVWANETDSEDDAGANAVAKVLRDAPPED